MAGRDDFGHRDRCAIVGIGTPATDDLFPTMHLPRLRAAAHEKYDDLLYASGTPM